MYGPYYIQVHSQAETTDPQSTESVLVSTDPDGGHNAAVRLENGHRRRRLQVPDANGLVAAGRGHKCVLVVHCDVRYLGRTTTQRCQQTARHHAPHLDQVIISALFHTGKLLVTRKFPSLLTNGDSSRTIDITKR